LVRGEGSVRELRAEVERLTELLALLEGAGAGGEPGEQQL